MEATLCDDHQAEWMEQLSDHILRGPAVDDWRQLFLHSDPGAITFRQQEQTLLCATSDDAWSGDDHVALARHFRCRNETARGKDILLAFSSPRAALHAAVILQKLESHLGVRAALATGLCTVAEFTVDGSRRTVTLGSGPRQAQDLAAHATTGSIALCPNSYEQLEDCLGTDLREALVITEMDDVAVVGASVILPPQVVSGASTFTGLGRT